jgi:flagellar biosynthesis protein FlhG
MYLPDVKLGRPGGAPRDNTESRIQTIAVTSGKGGVGKTNIATNLALALARSGSPTMLLDADLGMANVDVLLGLHANANLMDVLASKCRLEEIIIEGPDGLLIVPAASGNKYLAELGALECGGIVHAFSELKRHIDTLVIDTATGIGEIVTSFCRASHQVLVIAKNEPSSIRDCVAQIRLLNNRNAIAHFHVLANMVHAARDGLELYEKILELLGDDHITAISYAGFVPHDDLLQEAVISRRAVIDAYPGSPSALAIHALAQSVARWPRPGSPHGHLEFFVERILQQNSVEMEVLS